MITSSGTKAPKIHASAYVAPTATVSGDVTIGGGCAILHGAVITAEGAPITIGTDTIVMENAVIKASGGSAMQFPTTIGDRCIIGAHSLIVGAELGEGAFIGTGAQIYNTIVIRAHEHVAPNAARLPEGDFFETVFNLAKTADVASKAAQTYAQFLRKMHAQDTVLADHAHPATPKRRATDEPPAAPVEVENVVDAMMLELQEMELRRQEALKKKPKK